MVTFKQLRDAKPSMYHQSAAAWKEWADATLEHAGYLHDNVGQHIAPQHWEGMTAAMARGAVNDAHADLSASAGGMRKVEAILIQAGKDFEDAQQDLLRAVSEAHQAGFQVDDNGTVTVPASLTKGKKPDDVQKILNHARALQTTINGAVHRATRVDEGVARTLDGLTPGSNGHHYGSGADSGAGWNGSYGPSGGPPLQQPSGNLAEWIRQAMEVLRAHGIHLGPNDASYIATIIKYESGGNPHAINLWDSNAAAGHPSKGLMQTIDGTFNAYALSRPGGGTPNIWNPVDNIVAGVNYALHRYGSLSNVPGIRNLLHGGHYVGY